jgi:hypothetical protein
VELLRQRRPQVPFLPDLAAEVERLKQAPR